MTIYTVRHEGIAGQFKNPQDVKSYLYRQLFGAPSGTVREAFVLLNLDDQKLSEDLMRVAFWDGKRDLRLGASTGVEYTVSVA